METKTPRSSLDFNFALRDKARILRVQSIREAAYSFLDAYRTSPRHNRDRNEMCDTKLMANYNKNKRRI